MDGNVVYDFIRGHGKGIKTPLYYLEKPPNEEVGVCQSCKKLDLLGNGLCLECWDAVMTSKEGQSRTGRIKKGVEPAEKGKRVNKQPVTNRHGWSKGLTKYDHPGLMRISEKMTGQKVRLGIKNKSQNLNS